MCHVIHGYILVLNFFHLIWKIYNSIERNLKFKYFPRLIFYIKNAISALLASMATGIFAICNYVQAYGAPILAMKFCDIYILISFKILMEFIC
jgi:hypothetical protein